MKTIGEMLDNRLAQQIHDHCDMVEYDEDGNPILPCPDCGKIRCECDDEY